MIKLGYNAFCHWLNECHQSTKYRVEVKLLPMAKLHYVRLFPGLLSVFFALIGSEISEQASWQAATEE